MGRDDEFEFVDLPEDIHLAYPKGAITPAGQDALIRYWMRSNGKFTESVQQIGKSLNISTGRLPSYIAGLSATATLMREGLICVYCGTGPTLSSRSDYQRYESHSSGNLDVDGFCQECAHWHKPLAPASQWVLGHLTRRQLGELVRRYYTQEDCDLLVREYGVNLDPIEFAENIEAKTVQEKCRYCGQNYTFDAMSQVEYAMGYAERSMTCSKCGHEALVQIEREGTPNDKNYGLAYIVTEYKSIDGMPPCSCKQCEAERSRDPELRRQRIREEYIAPDEMMGVDELSLRQILCLLGMLWSRTSKDTSDIVLAPNIERMPLTPRDRVKWDWMRVLTKNQVIYVDSEKSPLNAFKEDDINTYYMDKVTYLPNVTLDWDTRAALAPLLSELAQEFRQGYWQDSWTEELLPVWKDIAVEECMAYVEERAQYYNLDVPNVDKLREIFIKLLDDFSVSEIWYMISAAYMNAAAFYQSEKCKSLAHATNTVPSKIISLSEQPRNQIRKWSRIKEIPRCAVTEVLFDIILGVEGDAGFTLSPGRTWNMLLDRHLARNPNNGEREFLEGHPLTSDEALRELAAEYNDPRIDALVEFAIEARQYIRDNG